MSLLHLLAKSPSPGPWLVATGLNRRHWRWFLGVLVFELWLATADMSPSLVTAAPVKAFVDAIGKLAPVVHNFDRVAPHPEALSLFFAVTTLLILPKAAFFFIWLNSSRFAMYRHFVVSPLATSSPAHVWQFITEPLHDEKVREEKPRSVRSRFAVSLLIVVILGLLTYVILQFGWELNKNGVAVPDDLQLLSRGGWWLWFVWSLKWGTLAAFFSAILACILRDYSSLLSD
jgi:hypothetical protein